MKAFILNKLIAQIGHIFHTELIFEHHTNQHDLSSSLAS